MEECSFAAMYMLLLCKYILINNASNKKDHKFNYYLINLLLKYFYVDGGNS